MPAPIITDVAVVELDLGAVRERAARGARGLDRHAALVPLRGRCRRFDVARAAVGRPRIVVAVGGRIARGEALGVSLVARVVVGHVAAERLAEGDLCAAQRDPVLRALGPGDARLDAREVELDRVRERRRFGVLVVPQALLLGVGLDERDLLGRAPG
jgi:hypothetical protein